MFNATFDVLVSALAAMARANAGDRWLNTDMLARELRCSRSFLLATLNRARQAGLVRSRTGPSGGYRLASPDVSLADVVRHLGVGVAESPDGAAAQAAAMKAMAGLRIADVCGGQEGGCPDCGGGTFCCRRCGVADWTCGTCGGIGCGGRCLGSR